jgi:hypothetical protein
MDHSKDVNETSVDQGCQMVTFQTKHHNLGIFWRTLELKMWIYILVIWNILRPLGIFYYGHLIILSSFGMLVCCTKKNLATLV